MSSPGRPRTLSTSSPVPLPALGSSKSALPSIESPMGLTPSHDSSHNPTPQSPATPLFRVPESPRSTGGESRASKAAKVAIPRLKRSINATVADPGRTGGRHRVNHACEPCRHRKTKCSGERPVCRHCQDFKISCFYADGKRDRVKKQFGSMTEKVADYEKLLKDLMNKMGDTDARAIQNMLDKGTSNETDGSVVDGELGSAADAGSESGAESEASAGAGSTGALDRTEEDFTRDDAKCTGFMGKTSEITWLQRLRQQNAYGSPEDYEGKDGFRKKTGGGSPLGEGHKDERATPMAELEEGFALQDLSYHLDDLPVQFESVDPNEMPTTEQARQLFDAYMTRVHPTFPIVGRHNLTLQFHSFLAGRIHNPPAQWLAILNLIFAIGAKYSHLIQAEWQGDDRDHLLYFSRARLLAMNSKSIFSHPDLQQIQVMGLMSFYMLCTGQINRSWTLSGMAIRSGTALGLNLRNESSKLSDDRKEIRYRVWWALYTLEHRLCSLTGRPNCIQDEHCTTPLPIPMEEDQFNSEEAKAFMKIEKQQGDRHPGSNCLTPNPSSSTPSTDRSRSSAKPELSRSPSSNQQMGLEWVKDVSPNKSLYFLHLVQLTRVSQNVYNKLYNPNSARSWSEVQTIIDDLEAVIEVWYRNLPSVLDFKRNQRDKEFIECRMNLGFLYYGLRITINRPCLCQLNKKLPNQSTKSIKFNRDAAVNCIDAAQELLQLIPDEPNAVGLNRVGPWWSLLHWLVEAASVLMLEISFRAYHMPEETENVFEAAKKAVRWMHQMGEENFSARRAWLLCNSLLRDAAVKIGREVTDLPENPPEGRGSVSSHGHSDVSMHSNPFDQNMSIGSYSATPSLPNLQANADMAYGQPYPTTATADALGYSHAEIDFITNMYHANQQQDPSGGHTRSQYN